MNETEPAKIKTWHRPNDACQQNQDPALDCNCAKKRRPYRVVRVYAKDANHGINPNISVEIFPDGTLKLREARRSRASAKVTTIGELYAQLTRRDALNALRKRNAERAMRRRDRKIERRRDALNALRKRNAERASKRKARREERNELRKLQRK